MVIVFCPITLFCHILLKMYDLTSLNDKKGVK